MNYHDFRVSAALSGVRFYLPEYAQFNRPIKERNIAELAVIVFGVYQEEYTHFYTGTEFYYVGFSLFDLKLRFYNVQNVIRLNED